MAKLNDEIPDEIQTAGISDRVSVLPIQPGDFDGFEAVAGGVLLGRRPLNGVLDEKWPAPTLGQGEIKIEHFDLVKGKNTPPQLRQLDPWSTRQPRLARAAYFFP